VRGESTIESAAFHTPEETVRGYGNRLFITEQELKAYREKFLRPDNEPLLVLTLERTKKYNAPVHMPKPVNMQGVTLSRMQYEELVKGVR
jgi:hypothetical protein